MDVMQLGPQSIMLEHMAIQRFLQLMNSRCRVGIEKVGNGSNEPSCNSRRHIDRFRHCQFNEWELSLQ